MNIVSVSVHDIKPYKKNAKLHPQEQVEHIANSIREFGWQQPIVLDKNKEIIIGHGRFEAAKSLGMEEVPCVYADNLTEEQVKALRLADNKTNESPWEKGLLEDELQTILDINMEDFGFVFEEEKEQKVEPEVEFTEVLGEEHNYVVLYFDNEVDWLQLASILDVEGKMNLSTRKDGRIGKNMKRISIGRVFNGAKALERMREHFENLY